MTVPREIVVVSFAVFLTTLYPSSALSSGGQGSFNLTVTWPELKTDLHRPQVCSSIRVPSSENTGDFYVTGLKPLGRLAKLHHYAIFLCARPGHSFPLDVPEPKTHTIQSGPLWACLDDPIPPLPSGPLCYYHGMRRVYNWDVLPQEYHFPEGQGMRVGYPRATYLVVTAHYLEPPEKEDQLGMTIFFEDSVEREIGAIDIWTQGFNVPPLETVMVDCITAIEDDREYQVYGFNPHNHALGRMVSAYRIRDKQWKFIGRSRPRLTEVIHPVDGGSVTLKKGDHVAFRCIMVNDIYNETVSKGDKFEDEMCMLMLYFTQDNLPTATYWDPQHNCIRPEEVHQMFGNPLPFPPEASLIDME